MYDIERQQQILEILDQQNSIAVNKLADMLFVSQATIRRDLTKMEQKGLVIRTFGAVLKNTSLPNNETSFELRESANKVEKRLLCQRCAEFLKSNSIIFIDSSTTLLNIVPYLNDFDNLTVITNGLFIANEIVNKTKHQVIVPTGIIQPKTNSILGPMTYTSLGRFHADVAIMSSSGLDIRTLSLTENTVDQAELKSLMVQNSDMTICLIDASKINKVAIAKTCSLNDIDILISTKCITGDDLEKINQANVKFVYAKI